MQSFSNHPLQQQTKQTIVKFYQKMKKPSDILVSSRFLPNQDLSTELLDLPHQVSRSRNKALSELRHTIQVSEVSKASTKQEKRKQYTPIELKEHQFQVGTSMSIDSRKVFKNQHTIFRTMQSLPKH